MPLLMCPNCNGSMTSVERQDVQIDMCPSCRGVWLDRGELEKLLGQVREVEARVGASAPSAAVRRDRDDDDDDWDDDDRRFETRRPDERRDPRRRRGGLFDMFDIFD
ncbi:MAG: hypothetical protein GC199_00625 [Alphaproteobacteria bacterium]|nr:hypothetical protein [Alphaproteobacteria bacterium]